ncbi:hypothetical protein BA893_00580 [Vibrio natriegens]|uniref:hypothetical protein n=1 Tax=Vibrio natriegens TaxID=691 RepID=UPI0008042077|nr:hypothetical protein [Vibrio natriegens]ANQ20244.1 hypothetical protein BA893_00580 [Vibrio natriegens]
MELPLPPKLSKVVEGKIEWQRLGSIDYKTVGFYLSCHLIVEHYLDEFIKAHGDGNFNWSEVRLTFSQKIKLLSKHSSFEAYNPIPSLKCFNSLRNKLAHNLNFVIEPDDLKPLEQFLSDAGIDSDLDTPVKIIDQYMFMVCTFLAGAIHRAIATE